MTSTTKKITFAGMSLALAFLLPYLIGQIPDIGRALSPMHIPVLICGFICGGPYGLIVGFIAPLLSSIDGMPPIFPTGTAMAFELAAYGLLPACSINYFPRKHHIFMSPGAFNACRKSCMGNCNVRYCFIRSRYTIRFTCFFGRCFYKCCPGHHPSYCTYTSYYYGIKESQADV